MAYQQVYADMPSLLEVIGQGEKTRRGQEIPGEILGGRNDDPEPATDNLRQNHHRDEHDEEAGLVAGAPV